MLDKENTQSLLIFRSSGLDCAFPLEAVQEIVPMATLSAPPGLPSGLAGFLDLRGTAIPIIRLDRLFDLPEQQPGLYTPLILLRGIPVPVGILANYVRCIVPVMCSEFTNIPEIRTFRGCAIGTVQFEGDLIHLLSPATLLEANENLLLAEFWAMSQARLLELEERN
jgi:purine-binding chemotaxis protein CheW